MICKYCKSGKDVVRKGITHTGKQRFYCKSCKRTFSEGKDNRGGVRGRVIKHSLEMRNDIKEILVRNKEEISDIRRGYRLDLQSSIKEYKRKKKDLEKERKTELSKLISNLERLGKSEEEIAERKFEFKEETKLKSKKDLIKVERIAGLLSECKKSKKSLFVKVIKELKPKYGTKLPCQAYFYKYYWRLYC